MVNWVDADGNDLPDGTDQEFKAGMYFSFAGDEVNMTFKNISKYPLNITSDELMERFVRGDASRNTEGHGLGLSIAQSLTELMGGQLSIAIDGDLFKITVAMKKQA